MREFYRFCDLVADGIVANRVTLYRWIRAGRFPEQVQLGPNSVAWRGEDVRAWVASRPPRPLPAPRAKQSAAAA